MNTRKNINNGMTLPEFIFAVMMLSAFMGVFVLVTKFIAHFFQPLNEEAKIEYIEAEKELDDVASDHMIINENIDSVIELFSQPGIEKNTLLSLSCTSLPKYQWKIESLEDNFPKGYELCIEPAFPESNYLKLKKLDADSKPGIYVIYARPLEGIKYNYLPVRRIFCRPKPFCSL